MEKRKLLPLCLFAFFFSILVANGQKTQVLNISEKAMGGEHRFNETNLPCVTPALRAKIDAVTHSMSKSFRKNKGAQKMLTTFDWPVQKSSTAPYFDVWAISNFVDHNTAFPNQITDYNCGSRSYDTSAGYNHQGIDIFLWPFSQDMQDNDYAEVVAAAPGTIFFKQDGKPDHSCAFNSNDWNAIYVVHADGSYALYGHMKKNSLTTKGVGDSVQAGEFLGVVGSSGNSTGPHLHFEVFDSSDNLIDPFSGTCNPLNNASWWNTQMNYREPNINAVMTHSAPPVFNPCPQTETINAQNVFDFGDTAYMAVYYKDQIAGTQASYTIKDNNGTPIGTWTQDFPDNFDASYYYYLISILETDPVALRNLTFEVSYNGQTQSHSFQFTDLGKADFKKDKIAVYPNPFDKKITVSGPGVFKAISLYDVSGKLARRIFPNSSNPTLETAALAKGVYFLKVLGSDGEKTVKTLVKK
jgi:hypothetical protein